MSSAEYSASHSPVLVPATLDNGATYAASLFSALTGCTNRLPWAYRFAMPPSAIKNFVGPSVRKIRDSQKLTQTEFAERCQKIGWKIDRNVVDKIERQKRWVSDFDLVWLAKGLRVPLLDIIQDG